MTLDILFDRYLLTVHAIVVAIGLVVYVGVSRALPQRRDPPAAIAWVVALALLPYAALPLFIMIGSRKLRMRDEPPVLPPVVSPASADDPEAGSLWARRLGRAMGLAPSAPYERLRVHAGGDDALAAALEVIASAERTLDVCTFILARDAVGNRVAAALEARAREGVRVRLLLDGIGRWLGGRFDAGGLKAAGVEVVTFVPPFRAILRGRANLRNHRKLVVADGRRLWCGGRNFAAEYFETWHDLSFDLAGPVVERAAAQFENDWAYATRQPPAAPAAWPGTQSADLDGGGRLPLAQIVPSGPEQADDTVQTLVVSGAFQAERRILAVTPYFIPDQTLLLALTLAARRGVHVELVLPRRSNHRLADMARPRPLRELAAAGARIRLVPHMVHAKAVVIDDELALAGSANLDARSLFLNHELMVAFYEPADVRRFADWIEHEATRSERFVARPPGLLRDLAEGLVIWLAFQL